MQKEDEGFPKMMAIDGKNEAMNVLSELE